MRIREGPTQPVFIRGSDDNVDMIGHQAIAADFSVGLLRGFAQQILVKRVVALFKKRLRASVATLGHVMGVAGNNKAG